MNRGHIARELVYSAHASASAGLRHLGLVVPSSLDVLAELRRGTPDIIVCQASIRQALDALELPYSDRDP